MSAGPVALRLRVWSGGEPPPTRRPLTGFQCLWWAPRQDVGRIGRGPGAGRDCVHAAPRPRRTSIKVGNPLPRISASPLCPPEWMQQSPRLGGWAGVCWGSCSRSFWSSIPVPCPRPLAIRGGQYRVELSIPPETGPAQTLDVTPESPLFGEWELVAPHRASCTSPPRLGSARLYVLACSVPAFCVPGPGYVCMFCFERAFFFGGGARLNKNNTLELRYLKGGNVVTVSGGLFVFVLRLEQKEAS